MTDWLQFTALVLLFVGVVLWFLPVDECSRCAHCTKERLERAEQRRLTSYCFQHKGVRSECDAQHKENQDG